MFVNSVHYLRQEARPQGQYCDFMVDTQIFLWALSEPEKLGIAGIMIKSSIGKLKVPFDPREMVEKTGFNHLPFTVDSALLPGTLPCHHKDLFDRMLITQALAMKISVMTADENFARCSCKQI